MRELFPVYQKPTDDDFSKMWQEGVFAFDANVLLNVYRYTPATRERLFEILRRLKDRIWLPYQAAAECYKHRLNTMSDQFKGFEKVEKHLNDSLQELEANHYREHPFGADISQLIEPIKNAIKQAKSPLQEIGSKHSALLACDPFWKTITELFKDKVGETWSEEDLGGLYSKAEERFKQKVPPGYRDRGKEGTDQYGDVVLWFQLIEYAKTQRRPLIFITDDTKEDWWLEHRGKTIGPRPELRQEMSSEADVLFHMYSSDNFMNYAQEFLRLQDQKADKAVKEAREVRKQEEVRKQQVLEAQRTNLLDGLRPSLDLVGALRRYPEIRRSIEALASQVDSVGALGRYSEMTKLNETSLLKEFHKLNKPVQIVEPNRQRGRKDGFSSAEAKPTLDQKNDDNAESADVNSSKS